MVVPGGLFAHPASIGLSPETETEEEFLIPTWEGQMLAEQSELGTDAALHASEVEIQEAGGASVSGAKSGASAGPVVHILQLVIISIVFLCVLSWIEFAFFEVQHKESDEPQYAVAMQIRDEPTRIQLMQQIHQRHEQRRFGLLVFAGGVTTLAVLVIGAAALTKTTRVSL